MIPFSPPKIYDEIIREVTDALKSGWITTGPRTKQFEKDITAYCGNKKTLCMGSATEGMELVLRWFGVEPGDEVIIPAYTYCATANIVVHCGAKPVMVDVGEDFNISVDAVRNAITEKTKVIIPVDIAGFPCDYDELNDLVKDPRVTKQFQPKGEVQQQLGRILVLSDAAHSLGAVYKGNRTGALTDITSFSFHAVKNLTTAEGGALCFNLDGFDNEEVYRQFNIKSLHGQSKDALSKTTKGGWRYDVVEAGYKCNMTDIQAAMGLVELRNYSETLSRRKAIFDAYSDGLKDYNWAIIPPYETANKTSSYHVFALRIDGITEAQRDDIIDGIYTREVSVNVHFQPLPLLSLYKNMGYDIHDFPVALDMYANEISLPVFYDLTDEQVQTVIKAVVDAVEEVRNA